MTRVVVNRTAANSGRPGKVLDLESESESLTAFSEIERTEGEVRAEDSASAGDSKRIACLGGNTCALSDAECRRHRKACKEKFGGSE
jgi:hypothetical protein